MAVLLPNTVVMLRTRTHPSARDAWGRPVGDEYPFTERGPYPARLRERTLETPDAPRSFAVGLAPEAWPVEAGDEIVDGDEVYVVMGQALISRVPEHPDVDYVRCQVTQEIPKVP